MKRHIKYSNFILTVITGFLIIISLLFIDLKASMTAVNKNFGQMLSSMDKLIIANNKLDEDLTELNKQMSELKDRLPRRRVKPPATNN